MNFYLDRHTRSTSYMRNIGTEHLTNAFIIDVIKAMLCAPQVLVSDLGSLVHLFTLARHLPSIQPLSPDITRDALTCQVCLTCLRFFVCFCRVRCARVRLLQPSYSYFILLYSTYLYNLTCLLHTYLPTYIYTCICA